MKKIGVLNSEISMVISKMGHNDTLAIGDCGLPIPDETQRIDIALVRNIPTLMETLKAVLLELEVAEVIIANETKDISGELYKNIIEQFENIKVTFVSHEELKQELKSCKAVIRTGEQTPFANIILRSGVTF